MTAREVLDGIKAQLAQAPAGPWKWDEDYGEANDTGLALTNEAGIEIIGAYNHHCCSFRDYPTVDDGASDFIAAAPATVARLTAAVEAVLALHKPEKRWMPYDGAGVSYDTERDALEASEDVDLGTVAIEEMAKNGTPFFEVCAHCKRIEDSPCEGECTLEAGYRESIWPCPTVAAIEGALEE